MSDKAKIEWTDATWNPVTGCAKVSQGCKNCYALRDWARMSANPKTVYYGRQFSDVQCHPERLDQPLRWSKPRLIFVNSMSDLFHEAVPDEFIRAVFGVMALAPHHTFQVLTKRPERMLSFMRMVEGSSIYRHEDPMFSSITARFKNGYPEQSWPLKNVWLGVSVENQAAADERIPLLIQTPAAVRWISAEPLLGPIDLRRSTGYPWIGGKFADGRKFDGLLDWVVVGGESGCNARPMHPNWARSLRDQCKAADVPFLFKQWGEWAPRSGELTGGGTNFSDLDPECKKWPDIIRLGEHGLNTRISENCTDDAGEEVFVQRVGKKLAGRLLNGHSHDGYPNRLMHSGQSGSL